MKLRTAILLATIAVGVSLTAAIISIPSIARGKAIASALANDGYHITSLAVPDIPRSGIPKDNLTWAGIDAKNIIKTVKKLLSEN